MEIITTETVAEMEKCDPSTVRKWAAANGVRFIGQGFHKNYLWTEADIVRFREREKPGRRWPEKEELDFNEETPKVKKPKKTKKGRRP